MAHDSNFGWDHTIELSEIRHLQLTNCTGLARGDLKTMLCGSCLRKVMQQHALEWTDQDHCRLWPLRA